MKPPSFPLALAGWIAVAAWAPCAAEDKKPDTDDPFAVSDPIVEKPRGDAPLPKKTTGGFVIEPYHDGLQLGEWNEPVKIEMPVKFNSHFDQPLIWRTDGGYLASFDGGEWGGALFSAAKGDRE